MFACASSATALRTRQYRVERPVGLGTDLGRQGLEAVEEGANECWVVDPGVECHPAVAGFAVPVEPEGEPPRHRLVGAPQPGELEFGEPRPGQVGRIEDQPDLGWL